MRTSFQKPLVGAAVVDQPGAVVVAREGALAGGALGVAVDRAGDRRHAARGRSPKRPVGRWSRRTSSRSSRGRPGRAACRGRRRSAAAGGLAGRRRTDVGRQVGERAVVALARRGVRRVVPAERRVRGRVVADAERPAVVAGLVDQVPLAGAGRGAVGLGGAVVVAELADADDARVLRVGVQRERLAEAHRVDLGTGLGRADREEVARRDGVGRAQAGLGVSRDGAQRRRDADDLAAQVGAVLGRLARVPALGRAVVHRRVVVVALGVGATSSPTPR